ncbi:MAG: ABC transporter ATP-binding protein [Dermabacter sp.]|nr:ABC transporter ATP-binding protein [Dermabacter sp.]
MTVAYRENIVLKGVTLEVARGACMAIVGPNGAGKSTLLKAMLGLVPPLTGTAEFFGQSLRVARSRVGYMPQSLSVDWDFPATTLTVVTMGTYGTLGWFRRPGRRERERALAALRQVGLEDLSTRHINELSGGQRQRVAMGRAIVRSPQVFLMDEPLSNLDAKLRVSTRTQIASLQRRLGVTTVYVTHDQTEAMTMGDRVAVLAGGVLQQIDSPQRMYDHPNNVFVAGFIGSPAMNLIEQPLTDQGVAFGGSVIPVDRSTLSESNEKAVTVGVRPEDLELAADGLPVEVDMVEVLGADAYVYGRLAGAGETDKPIIARVDGRRPPQKGETVHFQPKADHVHLFDLKSGNRLGD